MWNRAGIHTFSLAPRGGRVRKKEKASGLLWITVRGKFDPVAEAVEWTRPRMGWRRQLRLRRSAALVRTTVRE